MKRVIVLIVMSVLTISSSFASIDPDLRREIEKKVIVDLSKVEINESNIDYVMVSFRIEDCKIIIQDISGSNSELKEIILKKLYKLNIESECNEQQTYNYNFTFEKR